MMNKELNNKVDAILDKYRYAMSKAVEVTYRNDLIALIGDAKLDEVKEATRSKKSLNRSARENFAFDEVIHAIDKLRGESDRHTNS